MSLFFSLSRPGVSVRPAVMFAFGELGLTSLHHAYGAFVYDSPWRLEVVAISAAAAAIILALSVIAHRQSGARMGRIAFWANVLVILAFPIVTIGFVEGGYNHVLKNIVFLMHNAPLYAAMFPAGMYEEPGDLFFELTGVLQLPVAVAALWCLAAAIVPQR
jgi:hypothetical protein